MQVQAPCTWLLFGFGCGLNMSHEGSGVGGQVGSTLTLGGGGLSEAVHSMSQLGLWAVAAESISGVPAE